MRAAGQWAGTPRRHLAHAIVGSERIGRRTPRGCVYRSRPCTAAACAAAHPRRPLHRPRASSSTLKPASASGSVPASAAEARPARARMSSSSPATAISALLTHPVV
eukprot:scaffold93319_cov63-Phaeocystis_antarctica.AAC.1